MGVKSGFQYTLSEHLGWGLAARYTTPRYVVPGGGSVNGSGLGLLFSLYIGP
jgi:hypothetical protein